VYKRQLLQEGKLLGVLLTISAASILLKPFRLHQPLTCIITGSNSVDATTASLIATSLFYKSDDIIMEGKITILNFDIIVSSLNSLPIVIDREAIINNSMDMRYIISSITLGGTTRAKKNQTLDFKEFRSNAFLITEATELDEIKRSGAAIRRILHLPVDKWEQFTSLFDINTFRPHELYAGCGVDYIRYAMLNLDKLRERFEQETKGFGTSYKEFTTIALNIYAGILLLEEFYSQYYKQQVYFTSLREKFEVLLKEAKIKFLLSQNKIVEALQLYLYNNLNRFGQIKKVGENYNGYKYDVIYKLTSKGMLGEYDLSTQTYYITTSGFKAIAKELGIEEKQLIDSLIKTCLLYTSPSPRD